MPETQRHTSGKTVTVEATVSEVFTDQRSGTTFLNMGGRYPNEAFSAVIFSSDAIGFPNILSLEGKMIDVSGAVSLYKGRLEIIIHDVDQLRPR